MLSKTVLKALKRERDVIAGQLAALQVRIKAVRWELLMLEAAEEIDNGNE